MGQAEVLRGVVGADRLAIGSSAMQDTAPQVRPLIGASDADYVES